MQDYKVSGCIVVYNGFDEVETAVNSVVSHTCSVDFELFVVDNNSPDHSGEKLKNANFADNVHVIKLSENKGFGGGHNSVINKLNSKYHAVINPDITLDTDAVSTICAYLDEHPEVVMATPRLVFPSGKEQYTAKRVPSFMALLSRQLPLPCLKKIENHYLMLDEDLSTEKEIDFCTGCFFVMRTDVFKKINGFDTRYFMYVEDADITREAQKHGKVMYVPITHVIHAWHRDTKKKLKNFTMQLHSMFKYWQKWGFKFK